MRLRSIATITVLAGVIVSGPILTAAAQPAAPPALEPDRPSPGAGGPMGGPMTGMRQRPIDPSLFGLMYRPDDRKLTPPDVQKIAEAILLWFGNRTWKVTDVAPAANGVIAFAYATQDVAVIARFMDTRTGRVVRTG